MFWALRDLSFEVPAGQAVGVIGRNGAGKSTLLKILAGVTTPTIGEAKVWGTLGSLLEVGTGFHPELTGRENVFLNGAILGMRRAEVARRFDEIVAFSGIELFIDTPAKHYSSGMFMRLAFAVAAHLDCQTLVVDEVLAVGDGEFQRASLRKMEQAGQQGRTVIFVSHDMGAVTRLCTRVLLLDGGRLVADGPAGEVVHRYLATGALHEAAVREWSAQSGPGDEVAQLRRVRVLDEGNAPAAVVDIRRPVSVEVEYWNGRPEARASVTLRLHDEQGNCIFNVNDFTSPVWRAGPRPIGLVRSRCLIPGNFLAEGRITVLAAVSTYDPLVVHAEERDAVAFTVVDRSTGDGVRGPYVGAWPGVVRPMLEWRLDVAPGEALEHGAERTSDD
jgi:lipopolysaccharide transport system ATP-binding protein